MHLDLLSQYCVYFYIIFWKIITILVILFCADESSGEQCSPLTNYSYETKTNVPVVTNNTTTTYIPAEGNAQHLSSTVCFS